MRVLIIEDEDHLRRMMRMALEHAGYDVGDAGTGEEGLAQFGDGSGWDAVLLDQRLPGIDGLETLARIRQRNPDACVVMITAFASIDLAVDAMKLGATDFLRKPMTPEALRSAVAAAIGRTPSRRPGPEKGRTPEIVYLTMNGFQIARRGPEPGAVAGAPYEHRFRVIHVPDGGTHEVTVTIDPEEVARVARLSRRDLSPQGGFWREQAERRLAAHLWSTATIPDGGRLTLSDVPRDTIDLAAAWTSD